MMWVRVRGDAALGGPGQSCCDQPPAQHPAQASQGRGRACSSLAPTLFQELELRAGNGSAALTPAVIEFPLPISLASHSFAFCKVASLLPCSD